MTGATETLSAEELRDAWQVLDVTERADGLGFLDEEDAFDVFDGLTAREQTQLLLHWRAPQRRVWLRQLEPDDLADVIQAAPTGERAGLLALLEPVARTEVETLLAYEEDRAGGLMSPRYVRLRPQMTADQAIHYLRKQADSTLESIYVAYVLDHDQKLLGVVSLRDLFQAPPQRPVEQLMERDFVAAPDTLPQEQLGRLFAKHDLAVIPVVDAEGVMRGIVTVDDIVDVVQEEATEDIQKFGGLEALDTPYMQTSFATMVQKRGRWLAMLLLGEMLTTTALGAFQGEIQHVVMLALFIPLIISSGGNSGSQASTLVVRAMALREVRLRDWWRVMRRETFAGVVLGAMLAAIGLVRITVWHLVAGSYGPDWALVAVTVALSLWGVVLFGTVAGSMLPLLLRRLGADPASASAPLVATLVDVTGILIYFGVASVILARLM